MRLPFFPKPNPAPYHTERFGDTPDDVVVMVEDAIREWQKSRQAADAPGWLEHEECAMLNTFQALNGALRLAGVGDKLRQDLFRRLVAASEVLRPS